MKDPSYYYSLFAEEDEDEYFVSTVADRTSVVTPTLLVGDCVDELKKIPSASVDSVVTDPPYAIAFGGNEWDTFGSGQAFGDWCSEWGAELLRVLKPGGHVVAFSASRTYHWLAYGLEKAGFEIRDSLMWLYGNAMARTMDLYVEVEKKHGPEAAAAWAGWETKLKPGFEPIVLARKSFKGTLVDHAAAGGLGGLNTTGCAVKPESVPFWAKDFEGRHPANVVLSHAEGCEPGNMPKKVAQKEVLQEWDCVPGCVVEGIDATYGASRYFYSAKAPTSERPKYQGEDGTEIEHDTVKPLALMRWLARLVTPEGGIVVEPFSGSGSTIEAAMLEGFECWAVEREKSYLPLIQSRIERASAGREVEPSSFVEKEKNNA